MLLGLGSYRPAADPQAASGFDVAVIAVPTPLRGSEPDLSHVVAAGRMVGRHLRVGALVVLESTSYPGTTRAVLGPVLEEESGLLMGRDFALGFSPERIDPGNESWTLTLTPKLVSGIDGASRDRTADFYSRLVDQVVPVSRCEEAELAKLLENTFRAVNIALDNELAEVAHDTGLDIREAVSAAGTKPFGFMAFAPGPGIGGHCLPIDPVHLSWWAARARGGAGCRLIDLAEQINTARPAQVVDRVSGHLASCGRTLKGAQILLLGLSYKPGSGDLRESPALEVARLLAAGGARVRAADPSRWQDMFEALMGRIAGRFTRVEPRRRARKFVLGLLSDLPRKNCWTLAEQAGDATPYGLQHLLSRAKWDADTVRDDLRSFVVEQLHDEEAVLVVDETGDLKKGTATVGVQRQYTGTAGRIENSQVAVYLAYSSRRGHAAIDRELYVPRSWITDAARCRSAGIPEGVGLATKPALAVRMIDRTLEAGIRAAWVTADEVYGGNPQLRGALEDRKVGYVLAVACDHQIATPAGRVRADALAKKLPKRAWQKLSAGAGVNLPLDRGHLETGT